jgi:V-type H+-transporting ATPase subunit a
MTLGTILFGLNSIYNKDWVGTFLVFPARLLFFFSTIGYMVFLIVFKWLTEWNDNSKAPNIISVLLGMWMGGGSTVYNLS